MNYSAGAVCSAKPFLYKCSASFQNIKGSFSFVLTSNVYNLLDAGPWSCSLPAVRIVNSYTGSLPALPGLAESFPPLLLWPSPRTHPPTAAASSPSTSPSSLGAKLLTWLPSAAPQTAMQACTPPCPHSARPRWTSTSSMCLAPSLARSLMRARTKRTRWRTPQCANKVGQRFQLNRAYRAKSTFFCH